MGFSRQEYWSRLPFPTPGDLPDPGIEPESLSFPDWQVGSLPLVPPGKLSWFSEEAWLIHTDIHMVYMCEINQYPAPWISSPETFLYSLWLAYEYWQRGPPSALTLNSMNYTHLQLSAATEALSFLFYYRSIGRFLSIGREHLPQLSLQQGRKMWLTFQTGTSLSFPNTFW